MDTSDLLFALYVSFAFLIQALLIVNFAARNWRPEIERTYGWIIYALGAPSVVLGALMIVEDQPWYLVVPPFLYFAWTILGYIVDLGWPTSWRNPPRWSIFIPYVGLFTASLMLFWASMWPIGIGYWIAFGAMYVAHTVLNLYSHRQKQPRMENSKDPYSTDEELARP